jgi:hypothetical protein
VTEPSISVSVSAISMVFRRVLSNFVPTNVTKWREQFLSLKLLVILSTVLSQKLITSLKLRSRSKVQRVRQDTPIRILCSLPLPVRIAIAKITTCRSQSIHHILSIIYYPSLPSYTPSTPTTVPVPVPICRNLPLALLGRRSKRITPS